MPRSITPKPAKTMKAAVVREFGKPLTIEEVPVPEVGPGQILVKIAATGVCHTDLHAADGDWPVKPKPPFIPGHEGVGHVVAVGAGVAHVKEGDRVGVPWLYTACGHCRHCLGGWETLCEKQQNTGYSVNGGFAEYVVADPQLRRPSARQRQLRRDRADPLRRRDGLKGLKVTDTKPGDWVVISGIGGLGHMAVQYAKAMGLNVIAVGRRRRQARARQETGRGARRQCAQGRSGRLRQEGSRRRAGRAGDRGLAQGLRAGARHGATAAEQFRSIGLPPGDFPLSIFDTVLNGITVRGSIVGTRLDLQEALNFAGEGKVKATVATEPLENINDIFARMRAAIFRDASSSTSRIAWGDRTRR